ncbi:MAG: TerC family protein [Alphaproteobacteria bacterium]|jgi:tellurite resistance protein TerC|nr:TerC family protein [Candidatus Jidaibacter sp.]
MTFPLYFWIGFLIFLFTVIALDLGILDRKPKILSFKQASTLSGIWVLTASVFGTMIYYYAGRDKALEFFTGYVVELSLSMDNIFVFIMIFAYFKVPTLYQHRILFWGILGAIVMRLIMILGGVYLFSQFQWIFYVFGIILIISGIKIFFTDISSQEVTSVSNGLIRFLKRFVRVSDELDGHKFFSIRDNKVYATPLFVCLLLIEKADLIFAIDSIPAILAITQDTFIVFTSNMFAILGLRSLYFMLSSILDRFKYLKYGISMILIFIGIKMLSMMNGHHIPIEYSLLFILSVLFSSIALSFVFTRRYEK